MSSATLEVSVVASHGRLLDSGWAGSSGSTIAFRYKKTTKGGIVEFSYIIVNAGDHTKEMWWDVIAGKVGAKLDCVLSDGAKGTLSIEKDVPTDNTMMRFVRLGVAGDKEVYHIHHSTFASLLKQELTGAAASRKIAFAPSDKTI